MSIELLYTSAPQGLKQGSRGFCTVVSTVGMPVNLAQRLESLSGYRHVFAPSDPQAAHNPVGHSHLRITVGGRAYSILSRLAAYGIDYSQRTNKLAHHVVLDARELIAGGPAVLLKDPSVMKEYWDGQCRTLPVGPTIPAHDRPAAHCQQWQQLAGDAGWAGPLVDAWTSASPKPLWVIFRLEQSSQLLDMMAEAIALLPAAQRWQATFSTYYSNLPPDIDCRVRCVLAGSDEARMAASRGMVIDLTQPLPAPPPSPSVTAAREGRSLAAQPTLATPIIFEATPLSEEAEPYLPNLPTAARNAPHASPAALQPRLAPPPARSPFASPKKAPTTAKRSPALMIASVAMVCLLLALVLVGAGYVATTKPWLARGGKPSAEEKTSPPADVPTNPEEIQAAETTDQRPSLANDLSASVSQPNQAEPSPAAQEPAKPAASSEAAGASDQAVSATEPIPAAPPANSSSDNTSPNDASSKQPQVAKATTSKNNQTKQEKKETTNPGTGTISLEKLMKLLSEVNEGKKGKEIVVNVTQSITLDGNPVKYSFGKNQGEISNGKFDLGSYMFGIVITAPDEGKAREIKYQTRLKLDELSQGKNSSNKFFQLKTTKNADSPSIAFLDDFSKLQKLKAIFCGTLIRINRETKRQKAALLDMINFLEPDSRQEEVILNNLFTKREEINTFVAASSNIQIPVNKNSKTIQEQISELNLDRDTWKNLFKRTETLGDNKEAVEEFLKAPVYQSLLTEWRDLDYILARINSPSRNLDQKDILFSSPEPLIVTSRTESRTPVETQIKLIFKLAFE
jgi:hypothetical protein